MGIHVFPSPETSCHLPPHPIPLGCSSALALSALFHALNLDWYRSLLLLFSHSVLSDSLRLTWTVASQASLSFTISWSLLKLTSIESVMLSNHLISSVIPFSFCLQSFPASGSFLMSQLFASGGQSIGEDTHTHT